jgi:hypothetical protein
MRSPEQLTRVSIECTHRVDTSKIGVVEQTNRAHKMSCACLTTGTAGVENNSWPARSEIPQGVRGVPCGRSRKGHGGGGARTQSMHRVEDRLRRLVSTIPWERCNCARAAEWGTSLLISFRRTRAWPRCTGVHRIKKGAENMFRERS